ncbi:MAG TPA: hypothetical protein VFP84_31140 [Kofleriaceae bacterium]|nr:hypothetical protein [Kofleriaceae bacterium]
MFTHHTVVNNNPLPPPYQLAIEDLAFSLTVLDDRGMRDYAGTEALTPPTWFSVTLRAATEKRFLYLVQKESKTSMVVLVLLFDRHEHVAPLENTHGMRMPASGTWLRAVVDGTVHVLASDMVLSRKSITAWIGGQEAPSAQPPYT